jgi:hypothetical protein
MRRRARLRCACVLAALLAATQGVAASDPRPAPADTMVKAAFLPKFAAYVNWPPGVLGSDEDPVQLCVIGRDPFGPALDEAAARERIDQHPVVVRRLASAAGADHCQIAFIGATGKQGAAMLAALRGQPALTVTDAAMGPARGMIHFTLQGGRVRFHIDDDMAARSNLAISARLLGLALSVKPRSRA